MRVDHHSGDYREARTTIARLTLMVGVIKEGLRSIVFNRAAFSSARFRGANSWRKPPPRPVSALFRAAY
jgi:hypothetical protein